MRFKKRSRSRRSAGIFGRSRRHSRSSRGSGLSPERVLIPAFVYGAGRSALSTALVPLTSKIPLGQYADEAALGIIGYLAATKGSGMIKDVGMAMLTVEAASLGNQTLGSKLSGAVGGSANIGNSSAQGWI